MPKNGRDNKGVCSFARLAKILTAGILTVFRGLKFEHNAANGQTAKLSRPFFL
ncbi:MAG: hypothetical protein JRJ49_07520 [Deltaproteobacteria bacterium]|nr:hypothetical protein [Deltaproteobacteria bacterium]